MARTFTNPRPRRSLGEWGEELAADYLTGLGWQVVARNWRCPLGELDLVALEPHPSGGVTGVVVEVKSRAGLGFGVPLESITWAKLARLRRLAGRWRAESGLQLAALRIDGIGIVKQPGRAPQLEHVRGLA